MSITAFFVDALGTALSLGVATPDDVLKHVTPDVLAGHLPRPLWAKLLTACLAATRVDAALIVDTLGVPALCEHMPKAVVWGLLVEVAQRALGKSILAPPPPGNGEARLLSASPTSGTAAPGSGPTAVPTAVSPASEASGASSSSSPSTGAGGSSSRFGSSFRTQTPATGVPVAGRAPSSGPVAAPASAASPSASPAAADDSPPPLGAPPSSSPRVGAGPTREPPRPAGLATPPNGSRVTGAGASTRRPQANAAPAAASTRPGSRTQPPPMRRPTTAGADFEIDTDISSDWKKADPVAVAVDVDVDEDQLVDWAQAEETSTSGAEPRKR